MEFRRTPSSIIYLYIVSLVLLVGIPTGFPKTIPFYALSLPVLTGLFYWLYVKTSEGITIQKNTIYVTSVSPSFVSRYYNKSPNVLNHQIKVKEITYVGINNSSIYIKYKFKNEIYDCYIKTKDFYNIDKFIEYLEKTAPVKIDQL